MYLYIYIHGHEWQMSSGADLQRWKLADEQMSKCGEGIGWQQKICKDGRCAMVEIDHGRCEQIRMYMYNVYIYIYIL